VNKELRETRAAIHVDEVTVLSEENNEKLITNPNSIGNARKVGIITVYSGYNYGSALQVFALSRFVTSLGYKGVVIDYLDMSQSHNRLLRLLTLKNRLFTCIKRPVLFSTVINARKKRTRVSDLVPTFLKEKFVEFREKYLCLYREDYRTKASPFLAFICGSDQIWHSNSPGLGEVNFLRFADKQKRIAYAPSFGRDTVPDYNRKRLAKCLRGLFRL
jgi:hypothetical protein